jgi:hypothetical protein
MHAGIIPPAYDEIREGVSFPGETYEKCAGRDIRCHRRITAHMTKDPGKLEKAK